MSGEEEDRILDALERYVDRQRRDLEQLHRENLAAMEEGRQKARIALVEKQGDGHPYAGARPRSKLRAWLRQTVRASVRTLTGRH